MMQSNSTAIKVTFKFNAIVHYSIQFTYIALRMPVPESLENSQIYNRALATDTV